MPKQRKIEKLESIKNILSPLFKHTGLSWRIKEQKIIENWPEIVGQDIAQNTEASKVRGGVLYVKVSNPIWIQQLQFLKETIINKINWKIKDVGLNDLRFFVGQIELSSEGNFDKTLKIVQEKPSGEGESCLMPEEVKEKIAEIRDPEIRKLLTELYIKNKQGQMPKSERNKMKEEELG